MGPRGEPVAVDLGDLQIGEDLEIFVGRRGRLGAGERGGVVQIGRRVGLLRLDRADQIAQRRVLRAQPERALERGQRLLGAARAQLVAPERLGDFGIVGRERGEPGVDAIGGVGASVLREQLGLAQAQRDLAGLDRDRLGDQRERRVEVAAIEEHAPQLGARLGVIETERQLLLQGRARLVDPAQAPLRRGEPAHRPHIAGLLAAEREADGVGLHLQADRIEGARLEQPRGRAGVDCQGGPRLLERLPAIAALESERGQPLEQIEAMASGGLAASPRSSASRFLLASRSSRRARRSSIWASPGAASAARSWAWSASCSVSSSGRREA